MSGRVFYESHCRYCSAFARRFTGIFRTRGFEFAPLTGNHNDEMRVVATDGRSFGGADAVVFLARYLWWGWPVVLISKLPGAMPLLRRGYRWVAAHRYCGGGACRIESTAAVRPLFRCNWERVLMIHFEVDAKELQRDVPYPLDLRDGKTYVSLVAFTMSDTRPSIGGRIAAWLFRPIANCRFLNLRAYVKVDGERAIYFISEWLSNRLCVPLGPPTFGLPYRPGTNNYRHEHERGELLGEVTGREGRCAYHAEIDEGTEFVPCMPGTLAEFLMERYTAFTNRKMFRVWHAPWPQTPVEVKIEDASLFDEWTWFKHAKIVGANYSPGVEDVGLGGPHRLRKMDLLPLMLLPVVAFAWRPLMPAWGFMWALTAAMFFGCKWLTLSRVHGDLWRTLGYLFLWPGMDARAFTGEPGKALTSRRTPKFGVRQLVAALGCTVLGAGLLWGAARFAFEIHPLFGGWVGMFGLIFLLHFGAFHLLAIAWNMAGMNAQPIMHAPLLAVSVREFWGRRWNLAFHQLAAEFVFRPLRGRIGARNAVVAGFLASGLVHELVISVPARGGYGLPTMYFLIQAVGMLVERRGRSADDSRHFNRLFTMLVVAGPAFWLFHPPFVTRVVLPFMRAMGAL